MEARDLLPLLRESLEIIERHGLAYKFYLYEGRRSDDIATQLKAAIERLESERS